MGHPDFEIALFEIGTETEHTLTNIATYPDFEVELHEVRRKQRMTTARI